MHVQDPAYDGGRTIQIPEASKSKLSGSQKQYWEVKANYLDVVCFQLLHGRVSAQLVCAWLQQNASESVLRSDSGVQMIFFKVGKFYELYEEDAAIAYEVLGYKVTVSGVGRCRCVHALCQDCRCFGCRGSASILSNYLLLGSFSKFPAVQAGRRTRERACRWLWQLLLRQVCLRVTTAVPFCGKWCVVLDVYRRLPCGHCHRSLSTCTP